MYYLDSPTKTLKLSLDGAVASNELDVTVHFFSDTPQATTTLVRGGVQQSQSNGASDVTIATAPVLQGIIQNVHTITVNNKDTSTRTVTVKLDDNGTQKILIKQAIGTGESLTYEDKAGWVITSPVTAPFVDTTELVKGSIDNTKRIRLEADTNITSGATRVWTSPDYDLTVAALDVENQALSGGATVTSKSLGTQSSGTLTVDCGDRPLQHYTNNGAHTVAIASNDGSTLVLVTNGASAGAITFSGFTVGTNTGDPLTTTNGNKFVVTLARINSVATYHIKALQ